MGDQISSELSRGDPTATRSDAATFNEVVTVLGEMLQLGDRRAQLRADTALVGSLPEFDSMAVVAIITALEERFGIVVHDDEISAETFASVGTLAAFVTGKVGR